MLAVVALHVLLPALLALIHDARIYRWRGILTFVAICLVVGNIARRFDLGRYASLSGWVARRHSPSSCGRHNGRLGFVPGSGVVYDLARLDLAARRSLFRRAREQLLWLVSHCLRHLPVVLSKLHARNSTQPSNCCKIVK